MAAAAPPPPPPAHRMQELAHFFRKLTPSAVLSDCLGFGGIGKMPAHLAELWEHAVIVGIDTEAWTLNTKEMTEIGIVIFERKDMVAVQQQQYQQQKQEEQTPGNQAASTKKEYEHLGPFGEQLLTQIRFHHLRLVETAHLRTNSAHMRGPDGNHFGHSRFVTFAEARAILPSIFAQPIGSPDSSSAALHAPNRPIVLIGHATHHDSEHCRAGLGYDWTQHGTIVKSIDTQPLAKATRTWISPDKQRVDIGLARLTKILGFEHRDAHTACNDAARTVLSAVQMVLPRACRTGQSCSMQAVALRVEQFSRDAFASSWGTRWCCTRCGGRDHNRSACTVSVHCRACQQFGCGAKDVVGHIEQYCPHIARYNAHLRRKADALKRRRNVPVEPPCIHPEYDENSKVEVKRWNEKGFTVVDEDFPALPQRSAEANKGETEGCGDESGPAVRGMARLALSEKGPEERSVRKRRRYVLKERHEIRRRGYSDWAF
ncbi:hypothetical protein IQ07DRAFT_648888 [Pyrenochaeta sp. DS3sAY3a]|nr:hypothetical protein IQ07DRAFT_648888 [Pyrenochaeta sp. DS3sAY3a]